MDRKTKAFDCVEESRKWREVTSARLNAMSAKEELAHLLALGERTRARLRGKPATPSRPPVLREVSPPYGGETGA
jgi:hypothetical protein